jgi:transcription initiation factor TFIID subunit TAF12
MILKYEMYTRVAPTSWMSALVLFCTKQTSSALGVTICSVRPIRSGSTLQQQQQKQQQQQQNVSNT